MKLARDVISPRRNDGNLRGLAEYALSGQPRKVQSGGWGKRR
jgi:hypothetical protein